MSRQLASSLFFFLVFGICCAELLVDGCSQSPNCLTFGFSYPGPSSSLYQEGVLMKNGYILWAEKVNNETGIIVNGTSYKVELIGYDDYGNAATIGNSYQTLMNETDFLLGPYGTSLTDAANDVIASANRLVVFGSGTGEELFIKGYTTIFGVSASAAHYAETALEALSAAGAKTVSIARSTRSFTVQVSDGAVGILSKYNLTLLGSVQSFVTGNNASITTALNNLKTSNSDVALLLGLLADAEAIVSISKQINYQPKAMLLTSAPGTPSFVDDIGSDANYLLGPVQWHQLLNPTAHVDSFFWNCFRLL